jgi:hypothetical protein
MPVNMQANHVGLPTSCPSRTASALSLGYQRTSTEPEPKDGKEKQFRNVYLQRRTSEKLNAYRPNEEISGCDRKRVYQRLLRIGSLLPPVQPGIDVRSSSLSQGFSATHRHVHHGLHRGHGHLPSGHHHHHRRSEPSRGAWGRWVA